MSLTFHNLMHQKLSASDVHARINLDDFPFYAREKGKDDDVVHNKCGRDFLAYAFAHLRPKEFAKLGLRRFEREIGWPMPANLVWTGLSFIELPHFLKANGLTLCINGVPCTTRAQLWSALWFPKKIQHAKALSIAHGAIASRGAAGIDISMGLSGIANHVMYVWAIRDEDLVVFDTHKVPGLEYEHFDADSDGFPTRYDRFIMRLPFSTIENRWGRWSRVWTIQKTHLERPLVG